MEPILSAAAPDAGDIVKDTDTAGFAADVLDASMQRPVVVDFWAPWCGPCRTLGPALEKTVRATRGKVAMVKVNIDDNQQLAAQLRIQSIPAVYAFHQGKPVDAFTGALANSQLKSFVDRLVGLTGDAGNAIDDALAQAKHALEEGELQTAGAIYNQVLQNEPGLPAAVAGLARCLLGVGQSDQARKVLDSVAEDSAADQDVVAVRRMLELADQTAGKADQIPALMERLAADADDHQARFDLAMATYGVGDRAAAVDGLLEIVRRDREWNDQAARQQLLKLFEAFGPGDPLTMTARRRLSSMLFS
ncbi:MAG: thioredoxin [Alphaproteobacteria bacterium]